MVPTPSKHKALALKKLSRSRTWDCESEIYSHLQKKKRVLKSGTEKFNYFNTLLQDFVVNDPKGDPELVQFMDGLYNIVHSETLHLQDPSIDNNAEENTDGDDDEVVMIDPDCKYFWDHFSPHGNSYVLDIPEDGVFIKYEPELSTPKSTTAICTMDNTNHVSNEDVNVCLDTELHVNPGANYKRHNVLSSGVKRRGRKPKGAKLSAAMNVNVKSSDVTSKVEKHACNLKGRRRNLRLKMRSMKTDAPSSLPKDSDDETQDIIVQSQIVEHFWHEHNEDIARTLFKEKLMEELKVPYCEEEHQRLLNEITVRKRVQHHRDLRGRIKIYEKDHLGMSFLDYSPDLAEKIEKANGDHPRVLNLLRGFFYWLKNLSHEGAFMPWKDESCLDMLPLQLEG
ncbi:uncharacterized protein LOC109787800 [Cajanus cajan]|uniref:uncharacterized protein LOC109787800 n=1 Tax=Cajanus cajan TaxID=3821 RepID=UPI00098DA772|nr:uncharacterized protein LOC109787800 [Cajanus cajan]